MFSGYDPETGTYDTTSWAYEGVSEHSAGGNPDSGGQGGESEESASERGAGHELGGHGAALDHTAIKRDETLQHPRSVFQVLKRHYARYTPELVQETCGISPEQFLDLCEAVTSNSGRERTTTWVYSVGWTHHTVGVQYIRGSAIIQLLLGNMGRPGGGIMALRGHASIQGSTDIPTLFNLLPGYLPMPKAGPHDTLDDFVAEIASPQQKGFWTNARDLHGQPAQGLVGRRGHGRERLRVRLPAAADRRPRDLRDGDVDARRTRSTATSCSARTRPSARPTARCSGSGWRT